MLKEIQTSISANLYERMTSPLWGAIISGWLIVNWEVVYITFFEDEKYLGSGKLEYIVEHHKSWENFVIYPLAIALIFLAVIPFISTASYWLHLWFIKWKKTIKTQMENSTVMTVEESIKLRELLKNRTEQYIELTKVKDYDVKKLEDELSNSQIHLTEAQDELKNMNSELGDMSSLIEKLKDELDNLKAENFVNLDKIQELENAKHLSENEIIWTKELENFKKNKKVVEDFKALIDDLAIGLYYTDLEKQNKTIQSKLELFALTEFRHNDEVYFLSEKGRFFAKHFNE